MPSMPVPSPMRAGSRARAPRPGQRRRFGALALAVTLGLTPGCVGLGLGDLLGPPRCVGTWPSTERIPTHRGQRLRFATRAFDAAEGSPQLRGELVTSAQRGELTVIGLTPFGTRAFTATQRGTKLQLDAGIARRLGLEPHHLLDALHRGLWGEASQTPRTSGEAIEVASEACGYRTRLLVLAPARTRDASTE